jgi:hypothetical protein
MLASFYVSMLLNTRVCSLLTLKHLGMWEIDCCTTESSTYKCLSQSKHITSAVSLKNRWDRQSDVCGCSATGSSSGHSKFSAFATDLSKGFVSSDIPLFKINNTDVKYFLPKYTQTYPLDASTLIKGPNMYYKCYLEEYHNFETILILMVFYFSITHSKTNRKVVFIF